MLKITRYDGRSIQITDTTFSEYRAISNFLRAPNIHKNVVLCLDDEILDSSNSVRLFNNFARVGSLKTGGHRATESVILNLLDEIKGKYSSMKTVD